jgi:hypothetical protein
MYENQAYGNMEITCHEGNLGFIFNNTRLPLYHFHYDRFTTPDDEIEGKWTLNFSTDAQGDINQIFVSLDEKEVVFTRKADARLTNPGFLRKLEGQYERNGTILTLTFRNNELILNTNPPRHLVAYKGNSFRVKEFSDQVIEFTIDEKENPIGFKTIVDGREYNYSRKK